MKYTDLDLKKPVESENYKLESEFVISSVKQIFEEKRESGNNKIIIKTNLKMGLPLENINKFAAPLIEAWAFETFLEIRDESENKYRLINVEAQERLGMSDIILQFRKNKNVITGNIDVKATSNNIKNSGKSPNITSFSRIRTAYIQNPDFIFIILSIKHKVYNEKNPITSIINGIMELTEFNIYDLKYVSEKDIAYNPSLGTGQIQYIMLNMNIELLGKCVNC